MKEIFGEKARLYKIESAPFPIEGFLGALNIYNYLALISPSAISFALLASKPALVKLISEMNLKSDRTFPMFYASLREI